MQFYSKGIENYAVLQLEHWVWCSITARTLSVMQFYTKGIECYAVLQLAALSIMQFYS